MVTSNKNIELPFSISNSVNHGKFPQKTPPRASAVCLLFRRDQSGHTHAILTKRSTQVSSHKGQISLPGGHYESSDENLEYTALRETEEELGIPIHSIEVQSHLPKIHGLDGRSIFPIVATTECSLEAINPSSDEVATKRGLVATFTTITPSRYFEIFPEWSSPVHPTERMRSR